MNSPQGTTTPPMEWRISSYCNGGNCVQVAFAPDTVSVRDSKVLDGPVLRYSPGDWSAFVRAVKQGAYDRY
ncbi:DUF397 domain-containing protein [Streptosporangium sp. NPDC023615]|uniref:DUF397 domain-containing protein n=1 Tax=Streptosporangium sp. NPDC023615 TaxID=3154794 RepID=UPI00342805A1